MSGRTKKKQFCAPALLRQASEHNLNMELDSGFTHKIKRNMSENWNDWEEELFFTTVKDKCVCLICTAQCASALLTRGDRVVMGISVI